MLIARDGNHREGGRHGYDRTRSPQTRVSSHVRDGRRDPLGKRLECLAIEKPTERRHDEIERIFLSSHHGPFGPIPAKQKSHVRNYRGALAPVVHRTQHDARRHGVVAPSRPRRAAALDVATTAAPRSATLGCRSSTSPPAISRSRTKIETIHIVVNGEFYDFERIRAELEARGHKFRTKSDSEIALHLYEDYGPECLHHLRGEYAFVIWDERNQRMIAGRDRFGVKPLFYAEHNGALYLASEVKALVRDGRAGALESRVRVRGRVRDAG